MFSSSSRANDGILGVLNAPVGHDHVLREYRVLALAHLESIPGFGQSVDFNSGSDRELERIGIGR
jgi:hypothetical protein